MTLYRFPGNERMVIIIDQAFSLDDPSSDHHSIQGRIPGDNIDNRGIGGRKMFSRNDWSNDHVGRNFDVTNTTGSGISQIFADMGGPGNGIEFDNTMNTDDTSNMGSNVVGLENIIDGTLSPTRQSDTIFTIPQTADTNNDGIISVEESKNNLTAQLQNINTAFTVENVYPKPGFSGNVITRDHVSSSPLLNTDTSPDSLYATLIGVPPTLRVKSKVADVVANTPPTINSITGLQGTIGTPMTVTLTSSEALSDLNIATSTGVSNIITNPATLQVTFTPTAATFTLNGTGTDTDVNNPLSGGFSISGSANVANTPPTINSITGLQGTIGTPMTVTLTSSEALSDLNIATSTGVSNIITNPATLQVTFTPTAATFTLNGTGTDTDVNNPLSGGFSISGSANVANTPPTINSITGLQGTIGTPMTVTLTSSEALSDLNIATSTGVSNIITNPATLQVTFTPTAATFTLNGTGTDTDVNNPLSGGFSISGSANVANTPPTINSITGLQGTIGTPMTVTLTSSEALSDLNIATSTGVSNIITNPATLQVTFTPTAATFTLNGTGTDTDVNNPLSGGFSISGSANVANTPPTINSITGLQGTIGTPMTVTLTSSEALSDLNIATSTGVSNIITNPATLQVTFTPTAATFTLNGTGTDTDVNNPLSGGFSISGSANTTPTSTPDADTVIQ
ncbi:MAG: hypothetical protein H6766_01170 [Candidatus Peribacteria bacterium]|nr:MAG: hypothetical protein H6766_01170 [Candidatus Peribacteria bacterium]